MTDVNETLPTDSDQETTPAGVLDMGTPIAPTDEGNDAHGESADEYTDESTDESTTENMTGKNRLEGDADTGDEPAAVDGADADDVDGTQQQSVT